MWGFFFLETKVKDNGMSFKFILIINLDFLKILN